MNIQDSEFPYDSTKRNAIKAYFKNKANPPKHMKYSFSNEGNLEVYNVKEGKVTDTIQLDYYRPNTQEEYDAIDKIRLDAIIEIEEKIDIEKSLLRTAYADYKEGKEAAGVVEHNNEITQLEKQKIFLRSPIRDLINLSYDEGVEKRTIYFDIPFEKRKINGVSQIVYRDFPLWKLYGKYTASKEVHEATKRTSLVQGEVYLKNGKIARIFNDEKDENGFLSVFNVKDFVYKNTKFSSPYQAFEVYRLKEIGYEEIAKKLMESRAINYIKIKAKQFTEPMKNTKTVWKDILREFYEQHSEFLQKLVKTNDDILVFANTIPYLGGIGVAGQEEVLDSLKWKSPNIVGEVLMELRSELKETPVSKAPTFKESAKTEEQVAASKKGSIIASMKRRA